MSMARSEAGLPVREYGEGVSQLGAAVADVVEGLGRGHLWMMLAWIDIRQRYKRAMIGPFWITISMAVMIVALGTIYSALFRMDIRDFLPFVAAGFTVWYLINAAITEGAMAFTSGEGMLRQGGMPISTHVYRVIARNLIVFAHNAVVMLGVYVWQPSLLGPAQLLVFPGILLLVANLTWLSFILGGLCTRFRDLAPIVTNLLQVALFASPILFKPSQIPERFSFLVHFNPVFYLLEVVRAPLIGMVPDARVYIVLLCLTFIGAGAAMLFYVRARRRIVYWL
jgi:ABC-2 type transport system permease protein/lipopolysaccharide transport system permease protein